MVSFLMECKSLFFFYFTIFIEEKVNGELRDFLTIH